MEATRASLLSKVLEAVFQSGRAPLDSFKNYEFYYEEKLTQTFFIPAGLTFLIFLIWDLNTKPDDAFLLSTIRISFLLLALLLFTLNKLLTNRRLLRTSVFAFGVIACVLTEWISILLGPAAVQGAAGQLLILFFASGIFIVPMMSLLGVVAVSFASRLTTLWFANADFLYYFSDIYYLTVGAFLAATIRLVIFLFMLHAFDRAVQLRSEREKNHKLLVQLLPEHILGRLGHGDLSYAEGKKEVSIIFSDLVGFTALTKSISPGHLLDVLSDIFNAFDNIAKKYGIYRVKTMGDCYMAVSGMEVEGSSEAMNAINFAQDITNWIEDYSNEGGIDLKLRSGVATGSVVAGVIGANHPQFDVWGDTVNLASRLETTCPENAIQISEATYWRLQSELSLAELQEVIVSEYGKIKTYVIEPTRANDAIPLRRELS